MNIKLYRTNSPKNKVSKIFNKRSVDTADLLRISDILDFDFFELYSKELKKRKQK